MNSYDFGSMSIEELKGLLLGLLKEHQVTIALVTYCGSGDSGQIDGVEIEGGDTEGVSFPVERLRSMYQDDRWVEVRETVNITVKDLIEDLAYRILERSVSGWELDYGSAGRIEIDVATGKITLNHDWYELRTFSQDEEM